MLADTNPKMRGYFNPRSREGSDFTCRLKGSCINISIRAPTRGATIIGMLLTLSSRFQSALPRGERLPMPMMQSSSSPRFQSALPRGERPYKDRTIAQSYTFQSALPRGERQYKGLSWRMTSKFQSALPRGERHCITRHICLLR